MVSRKSIAIKQKKVDELGEIFSHSGVYLFDYRGLPVKEMQDLREKVKALDANIKVIKNRLAIKYFEREKKDIDPAMFKGPIAVAYSGEKFVEVAKVIVDFESKNKKIKIKSGFIEQKLVNESDIKHVAKLPGRMQLMSQLAYSIAMPLKKFGMALSAPLTSMMVLLHNLKEKKEKEAINNG